MTDSIEVNLTKLHIAPSDLSLRIHDLREAIQTMTYAIADIKAGYRFDDSQASGKISTLEQSATKLCRDAKLLLDILVALQKI